MSEQENTQVVQQLYAAFGRGDLSVILALLADEVEWLSPGPPEIPWAAHLRGRDLVAGWFARLSEVVKFEHFILQEICTQGDTVMTLAHGRFQVKSTGRIVDNDLAQVFKLRGGKVVSFCEYYDTATMLAALRND